MAFFGFENNSLENEKQKFLNGGLQGPDENLAVYTWGEEGYDGLGASLQEGGDELNDETFGGEGPVGKDFNFAHQGLPQDGQMLHHAQHEPLEPINSDPAVAAVSGQRVQHSLWDEKSPFSVLPRSTHTPSRFAADEQRSQSPRFLALRAEQDALARPPIYRTSSQLSQGGGRTLAEVEEEMRAANRLGSAPVSAPYPSQHEQHHMSYPARERQSSPMAPLGGDFMQHGHSHTPPPLHRSAQLLHQSNLSQVHQSNMSQIQQPQHRGTPPPPPRMHPHAQSPRFLQLQQDLLIKQQNDQLREQRHLRVLQEQLQAEEVERQTMRQAQAQIAMGQDGIGFRRSPFQHQQGLVGPQRQTNSPTLEEVEAARRLQRMRLGGPGEGSVHRHVDSMGGGRNDAQLANMMMMQQQQQNMLSRGGLSLEEERMLANGSANPADIAQLQHQIQRQQRMLSEAAQIDFLRSQGLGAGGAGIGGPEEEEIKQDAMRRILHAEHMEEKRRRKHAKIAHMARYNDLMTQSDKDFITRIQVSQLVTQDPWAEDFYAQIYAQVTRQRQGLQPQERIITFGTDLGGVGMGVSQRPNPSGRRANAIQKMEAQVEKIVQAARLREREKGSSLMHSLQGALGKTAGRSYKAAPRPLLQVDAPSTPGHEPRKDPLDQHGAAEEIEVPAVAKRDPLSRRECLTILEELFAIDMELERLRRQQPPVEDEDAMEQWEGQCSGLRERLWQGLRVHVPFGTSNPHPFISLMSIVKGKMFLNRVPKYLTHHQQLTTVTLLHRYFSELDVVVQAPLLDSADETPERRDMERQTEVFINYGMDIMVTTITTAPLGLLTMFLRCLVDSDILSIARSRPGIALLTLFMNRIEIVKDGLSRPDGQDQTPESQIVDWLSCFDHLLTLLDPHMLSLFPSNRMSDQQLPPGHLDTLDHPVWKLLANMALHASDAQRRLLVTSTREKIIETVTVANKGLVADEDERRMKLANVNLLLNALDLDSSQIAV